MRSSNYLIFVDESGDHLLTKYPPDFPVFVLAFVIVTKAEYCDRLLPRFAKLKLKYFPDVNIIFHEREIRKAQGKFEILTDTKTRTGFMHDLSSLMQEINYKVVAVAINKAEKASHNLSTENLYELGVKYGLAAIKKYLQSKMDENYTTITFEARGKKEDKSLADFFMSKAGNLFDISIQRKSVGGYGLQFADLIARPIGTHILKPKQANRAWQIIENKIYDLIILPK